MDYKDLVPDLQKVVQRMKEGDVFQPLGGRDAVIIFYLAEAKNRQTKREPIPEKYRKQIEEQLKKSQEKRQVQHKANPDSDNPEGMDLGPEEVTSDAKEQFGQEEHNLDTCGGKRIQESAQESHFHIENGKNSGPFERVDRRTQEILHN